MAVFWRALAATVASLAGQTKTVAEADWRGRMAAEAAKGRRVKTARRPMDMNILVRIDKVVDWVC